MSNTFSKTNKQITFFGELATTIATTNTLKEGNKQISKFFPDISTFQFADTNSEGLAGITRNRKEAKIVDISVNGEAGGDHLQGQAKITDQVWSDINSKFQSQTQILVGCVGGGTFGSLIATARRIEAEGKKVIIFCFDLWVSDGLSEDRHSNRKEAQKALSEFSHCFIPFPNQGVLGACEAVKKIIDDFEALLSYSVIDSNDWTKIMSTKKQFCLVREESRISGIGQKMALSKVLQSVKLFANKKGKITNYGLVVTSPTGDVELAEQTKNELDMFISDDAKATKASPVARDTNAYLFLATL